jgi:hypothetical protein
VESACFARVLSGKGGKKAEQFFLGESILLAGDRGFSKPGLGERDCPRTGVDAVQACVQPLNFQGVSTMRHSYHPYIAFGIGLVLLGIAPDAKADVVVNVDVPISITLTIPCTGDVVTLTGPLHVLDTLTFDNTGGVHVKMHANPQGVSGEGTSGIKYQGTGVTQTEFNAKVGFEETFINRFDIIGQGGTQFKVHETAHVTVNANGTVTTSFDNFSIECD